MGKTETIAPKKSYKEVRLEILTKEEMEELEKDQSISSNSSSDKTS